MQFIFGCLDVAFSTYVQGFYDWKGTEECEARYCKHHVSGNPQDMPLRTNALKDRGQNAISQNFLFSDGSRANAKIVIKDIAGKLVLYVRKVIT